MTDREKKSSFLDSFEESRHQAAERLKGHETCGHQNRPTVLQSHGYDVQGLLGRGSYAMVRRSKSERHKRDVAVKIISKRRAPSDYLKRFLPREIAVIQTLRHNNVVCFLQCIETTNRVYIIMELATHGDLLDFIKKAKTVDEKRACRWFHHILDGICYCHTKGVVHRDLKCENLLLNHDHVLKITDFGFARGELNLDVEGPVVNKDRVFSHTYCGSYAYAAPEILKGTPYELHKADVWSMGVVLFTMVCGRLPFDDTNHKHLLQQVQKPVSFPATSKISAGLRDLIRKILMPASSRVYFAKIREDPWYKENWDPIWHTGQSMPSIEEKKLAEVHSEESQAKRLTAKESVQRITNSESAHEKDVPV